ncbi:hypothetical protein PRIPAC_75375 [Pristionchus pacificus]|uniref:Uncharacterized protein n=1 Tax=Pristionchus pacificus TaxID=54126 RepID=A0A2A6C1M9_PRIPA|nr:hypothetical protein PRIPAC_75375 [Pristionchus pacificus]|eukprot:PDM72009.1 hypothetical protein PRIPAC_38416 [Pristionchus pacificus]
MYTRVLFVFLISVVLIMSTEDNTVYDKTKTAADDAHRTLGNAGEAVSNAAGKVADGGKGAAQGLADSVPGKSVKQGVHKVGEALSNSA